MKSKIKIGYFLAFSHLIITNSYSAEQLSEVLKKPFFIKG